MSSIRTAGSPNPLRAGESATFTNGNSPMKSARKVVSSKPKQDDLEALRHTEEELKLCRRQLEELQANFVESEKQRTRLFLDLPVPMYVTDAKGMITHFNQAASALWGREPEVGKDKFNGALKIYDADGNPISESNIPTTITIKEKKAIKNAEIIIERPDRTRRNIIAIPQPLFSADGNFIACVNTLVDITERKNAEELIKESEATLRTILNNTKDSYVLYDRDAHILGFNEVAKDQYLAIHGTTLETGKSVYELTPPNRHNLADDVFKRCLQGETFDLKVNRVSLNGIERWFKSSYYPVISSNGEVIAVSVKSSDVTEEVTVQSAIEKSEANLRALFDNAKDGFVLIDLKTNILAFNHAAADLYSKVIGKTLSIGKSVAEVLGPQLGDYLHIAFEKVLSGEFLERKSKQHGADGKEYWLRGFYNPVKSTDESIIGICMGISDITDEMTFHEELERKVKERTSELKEKNAELRQQKDFMETVLDSSIDQICVYDKETRFLACNKKFLEEGSLKATDIIGKTFLEVYPGLEDSVIYKGLVQAISGHASQAAWKSPSNGRTYTIFFTPPDKKNNLYGAMVSAHDNTEIIEASEKLQTSNSALEERNVMLQEKNEELIAQKEFIETVIDSSVDYITVYDIEARVITMNKQTEKLLNYKHGEAIGKTFLELFPLIENSETHANILRTLAGESTHHTLPKGNMSHAFDIYTVPLKHLGKVYAALVLVHDITEIIDVSERLSSSNELLEQKNDALQREKDLVETMIDSSVDFIGVYDKEMKLISLNKKTLDIMGIKKEDIVGKTFWEINKHTPGNQEQYDYILRALNGEFINKVYPRSAESLGRDYELFYIPLKHNNEVYAALGMIHDVTDVMSISEKLRETNELLEEKNSELEQSNIELGRFAYAASHDLQEPLRKIQMFAGMILERSNEIMDETSQNYFNRINIASERMSTLIKDILNYSLMTSSSDDFEGTDLNDVIKYALSDFDLSIEEKKATIEIQKLPVIDGIPAQLSQLFRNLIGNSLKFSCEDDNPNIQIFSNTLSSDEIKQSKLDETNSYYNITFRDNGIGFSQEYAEKIFVIFQRLNERSKYEGTGIGLALCRKIVDKHHGIIYAESKEGEGAEFHIILPDKQSSRAILQ